MPTENKAVCPVQSGLKALLPSSPPWTLTLYLITRTCCCFLSAFCHVILPVFPPLGLCQWYFFYLVFPKCCLHVELLFILWHPSQKSLPIWHQLRFTESIFVFAHVFYFITLYCICCLHALLTSYWVSSVRARTPTLFIVMCWEPTSAPRPASEPNTHLLNEWLDDI